MKSPFQPGTIKVYETIVTESKLASFETGLVHPVYSTFALGKDVEWACRLFVLEMKEDGEEGIGSFLSINHVFPAPLLSKVRIEAKLEKIAGNTITCSYKAYANERLIASGEQVQKIINKKQFDQLIAGIMN